MQGDVKDDRCSSAILRSQIFIFLLNFLNQFQKMIQVKQQNPQITFLEYLIDFFHLTKNIKKKQYHIIENLILYKMI